jgi:hypothetical protein
MALFSSIFRLNDERATARLNWAQAMTSVSANYLLSRGLHEFDTVSISTGMGTSAFSCSLPVRAEDQDVDLVLGHDWYSLYSVATWSSNGVCLDHQALSDRTVNTPRPHLSSSYYLHTVACANLFSA